MVDDEAQRLATFMSDARGEPVASVDLPCNVHPAFAAIVDDWRAGTSHIDTLSREEYVDLVEALQPGIQDLQGGRYIEPEEIPDQVVMHALPFDQGALFQALQEGGRSTIRLFDKGDEVYVQVADDGPGISPERLARFFDVGFSAADSRVKMSYGLPAAYAIVHEHEGDIDVSSTLGEGTTVTIRLPRRNGRSAQNSGGA